MTKTLRLTSLKFLADLPPGEPVTVASGRHGPASLRLAKQLEEQGLVHVVQRRPKRVRVASSPYAQALHGLLRTRSHLIGVLEGHHVPVLAVLAETADGESVGSLAEATGRHPNTIRTVLTNLQRRALVQQAPKGYRLARHVPELNELGHLYHEHLLHRALQRSPGVFPVARRAGRIIVESDRAHPELPPTGFYRLQLEGAPVLESRYQYAITPSGKPSDLRDAFEDAKRLAPSPRTLEAAKRFLRSRGIALA